MENKEQLTNELAQHMMGAFEFLIGKYEGQIDSMTHFLEAYVRAGYILLQTATEWEDDILGFTFELTRIVTNRYIEDAKAGEVEVREVSI